jgi:hypothetical protein
MQTDKANFDIREINKAIVQSKKKDQCQFTFEEHIESRNSKPDICNKLQSTHSKTRQRN